MACAMDYPQSSVITLVRREPVRALPSPCRTVTSVAPENNQVRRGAAWTSVRVEGANED